VPFHTDNTGRKVMFQNLSSQTFVTSVRTLSSRLVIEIPHQSP
jgi:hypothetical protein